MCAGGHSLVGCGHSSVGFLCCIVCSLPPARQCPRHGRRSMVGFETPLAMKPAPSAPLTRAGCAISVAAAPAPFARGCKASGTQFGAVLAQWGNGSMQNSIKILRGVGRGTRRAATPPRASLACPARLPSQLHRVAALCPELAGRALGGVAGVEVAQLPGCRSGHSLASLLLLPGHAHPHHRPPTTAAHRRLPLPLRL